MILATGRLYNSKGEPKLFFTAQSNPEVDGEGTLYVSIWESKSGVVVNAEAIDRCNLADWLEKHKDR